MPGRTFFRSTSLIVALNCKQAAAYCFVVLALASTASAQVFPTKPVTLVVAFPQGAGPDIVGRLLAEKLAAGLGQSVNVQNVPGKSATVGVGQVAKAPPDGYTIVLSGDAAVTTATVLYQSVGYDPRQDLAPISRIASSANAIVVAKSSPFQALDDLIKAAKQKPGQLTMAHGGVGFSGHIAIELLRQTASVDIKPLEITAGPQLLKAMHESTVDAAALSLIVAAKEVKEGRVRALAVTGAKRAAALPDVPTVAELGLPGYDASSWFALLAPKGTPQVAIDTLHAETVKVLGDGAMRERLSAMGWEVVAGSPAELRERISTGIPQAEQLLKNVPRNP
jgi:tripartite-type tricarboxylate transporter receptor subunit TctC